MALPAPELPDAADLARSKRVVERLKLAADPDGFLRFDRFVEVALYAEGAGYYASAGPRIGPSGDFLTAPQIDPLFGRALADRVLAVHRALGAPERFCVAELGPGDASLAAPLLEALAAAVPGGSEWTYVMVERSPALRELSTAKLASAATGPVAVRYADALGADGPFTGVVIANEFLDALPFRRLVFRGGAWHELGVRWTPDGFVWTESERPARYRGPALAPGPREGAVTELSEAAEAIPRAISDVLVEGVALLIDYGYGEDEYLRGHANGTLQALRAHRALAEPLGFPGLSDLSAFVRWERVRARAREAGLHEARFTSQAEALVEWGYPALVERRAAAAATPEEAVRLRLRSKNLLFGFGTFRVLELGAAAGPQLRDAATRPDPGPAPPAGPAPPE